MKKTIRNSKGETITEVLVASLVISLGFIILVTMIQASFRMIKNSEETYGKYYKVRNAFEAAPGSLEGETLMPVNVNTEVTLKYLDGIPMIDVNPSGSYKLPVTITSITADGVTIKKYSYRSSTGS